MIGYRFQQKISRGKKYKAHPEKARNDALGAVVVKVPNPEFAVGQSPHDYDRHEIAGDHEKNIDSNKSSRNEIGLVMKQNHRGDRERPQGINVVPEFHGAAFQSCFARFLGRE
jgi:hypothetical protein